jgi:hypothetical protein
VNFEETTVARRSHEKFRVLSTLFYLSALIGEERGRISLHVMHDAVKKRSYFKFISLSSLRNERSVEVKSSWPSTKPSAIPWSVALICRQPAYTAQTPGNALPRRKTHSQLHKCWYLFISLRAEFNTQWPITESARI